MKGVVGFHWVKKLNKFRVNLFQFLSKVVIQLKCDETLPWTCMLCDHQWMIWCFEQCVLLSIPMPVFFNAQMPAITITMHGAVWNTPVGIAISISCLCQSSDWQLGLVASDAHVMLLTMVSCIVATWWGTLEEQGSMVLSIEKIMEDMWIKIPKKGNWRERRDSQEKDLRKWTWKWIQALWNTLLSIFNHEQWEDCRNYCGLVLKRSFAVNFDSWENDLSNDCER